jgi:hypothetical protein
MEENGCSVEIQKNLHILDKSLLAILFISLFIFGISIWNMVIIELYPVQNFYFTTIFPPYAGIAGGACGIITYIAIMAGRRLRDRICPRDGVDYTLLGLGSRLAR